MQTAERKKYQMTNLEDNLVTRSTHYRWFVCALMFFAMTINYLDRQVFGILGLTECFATSILPDFRRKRFSTN